MLASEQGTACPDCPRCGCYDVTQVPGEWDDTLAVYVCNHCRHKFEKAAQAELGAREPMAIYHRTICPWCRSKRTVVIQGPRGPQQTRRHECRACGNGFQSREM